MLTMALYLTVISKLLSRYDKIFTWFENNHMKANPEKCHLLVSLKTQPESLFNDTPI